MKRLFGLLITALLFTSVFAQTQTVDEICSQLFVHQITKGDLKQIKTIKSTKRTREMVSTGKFLLCPKGIALEFFKPVENTMAITDDCIIQIVPDPTTPNAKIKNVTRVGDNLVFSNVSSCIKSLFTNDATQLKNNFTCDVTSDGAAWSLKLTPKDATIASALSYIIMEGTSAGKTAEINSLAIYDISENVTKCVFSNQTYPDELSDEDKKIFKK